MLAGVLATGFRPIKGTPHADLHAGLNADADFLRFADCAKHGDGGDGRRADLISIRVYAGIITLGFAYGAYLPKRSVVLYAPAT